MKSNYLKSNIKNILKTLTIVSVFLLICATSPLHAQLRVGDPGVTFDASKYDSRYPQMKEWQKAGVEGGIPFLSSTPVKKTISATNSSGINAAINEVANNGGGTVRLLNGTYTLNESVRMKSNVRLLGESKDGVRLIIKIRADRIPAVDFNNVQNAGVDNLTIEGGFGVPNDFDMSNVKDDFKAYSVFIQHTSSNCWLDKVVILNSGRNPLVVYGSHNTIRSCHIERCWNKGASWHGYFQVSGFHNLVYDNTVKKIRHLALQQGTLRKTTPPFESIGDLGCRYNVVYKNNLEQDVNFHNKDDGDNLVEQNNTTLPKGLKGNWHAMMGPWASFHDVSKRDNYIYKNKCKENNNGGKTPFSDDSKVYIGAKRKEGKNPFETTNNTPKGGTFYPVILSGTPSPPTTVPVNGVSLSQTSLTLEVGKTSPLSATVSPANASDKSVTWSSDNNNVASVDANGVVTAKAAGSATITVKTVDGNKTADAKVTASSIGVPPPPTGGCSLPKPENDITINKQTVNYSSGAIDISCASNVTISMSIEGVGPMENADFLNIYYKVDGGSQIAISENTDAFALKTISATGISGNSIEIIINGFTSFGDETYTVSNILISGSGGTPPPTPTPGTGDQNDTSINFTKPSNNQTFNTGDDVVVNVTTADNGNVDNVALYLNGALVRKEVFASYDWGHTAALDPVLKNMNAGTYTLKAVVTEKSGKVSQNEITIAVGTGKKAGQIPEDGLLIVTPNPVVGTTLNVTQKGVRYLKIANILGQVVQEVLVDSEQVSIDIANLSAGMYIIRADNGANTRFLIK